MPQVNSSKKKLLNGEVNFPFMLAPMVGLSHVALRQLIFEYLPKECKTIWPTEMLSSRRLPGQEIGKTPQTLRHEGEDFLVPQILGNDKVFIQSSIQALRKIEICGVDINMGCPVQKALKHNYGVSLMGDPEYAFNVVRMAVEASDLPVSVKIRSGENGEDKALISFAKGLEKAGASWICLHPRTAKQKRRGSADWRQIQLLKSELSIPIIGNGDIQIKDDVFKMLERTHCDGVMIGRAMCARPWLLGEIAESLGFETQRKFPQNGYEEAREMELAILRFIELCEYYFEKEEARKRVLFYLRVAHPWLNFGHSLVKKVSKEVEFKQMKKVVEEFFQNEDLFLTQYTELKY